MKNVSVAPSERLNKLFELHDHTKILICANHTWLLHIYRTPLRHDSSVHHTGEGGHVRLSYATAHHIHASRHPHLTPGVHCVRHARIAIVTHAG